MNNEEKNKRSSFFSEDQKNRTDFYTIKVIDDHINSIKNLENNLGTFFCDFKGNVDDLLIEVASKLAKYIVQNGKISGDGLINRITCSLEKIKNNSVIELLVGPKNFRLIKSYEKEFKKILNKNSLIHISCDETFSENNFRIESDSIKIESNLLYEIKKMEEILYYSLLPKLMNSDPFGYDNLKIIQERIELLRYLNGFDIIREVDSAIVVNILSSENALIIALVVSQMSIEKATEILSMLPESVMQEVKSILDNKHEFDPELMYETENLIFKLFNSQLYEKYQSLDGVDYLTTMLSKTNNFHSKMLFKGLIKFNPELAGKIKSMISNFSDIIFVSNLGIQKIIKQVNRKNLAIALFNASNETVNKFVQNMSTGAVELLYEEMDILKNVDESDIYYQQSLIIDLVRNMEERGESQSQKGSIENIFTIL